MSYKVRKKVLIEQMLRCLKYYILNFPRCTANNWQVMGETFSLSSNYKIVDYLGSGAYGVVCAAIDTKLNSVVAIKKYKKIFQSRTMAKRTLREIRLLRLIQHDNIIKLLRILAPKDRNLYSEIYGVFEIMETDLAQIIRSPQTLYREHIQYFMFQLILGLRYIHSIGILHRDIKPRNLLVNEDCKLKIADFGLARVYDETSQSKSVAMTEYITTRWYRSPEIIVGWPKYDASIDMWASGCILAELIGRTPLFPGTDSTKQLEHITDILGKPSQQFIEEVRKPGFKHYLSALKDNETLPTKTSATTTEPSKPLSTTFERLYPQVDSVVIDLIKKILVWEPKNRWTASQSINHPFLKPLSELWEKEHHESLVEVSTIGYERTKTSTPDTSAVSSTQDISRNSKAYALATAHISSPIVRKETIFASSENMSLEFQFESILKVSAERIKEEFSCEFDYYDEFMEIPAFNRSEHRREMRKQRLMKAYSKLTPSEAESEKVDETKVESALSTPLLRQDDNKELTQCSITQPISRICGMASSVEPYTSTSSPLRREQEKPITTYFKKGGESLGPLHSPESKVLEVTKPEVVKLVKADTISHGGTLAYNLADYFKDVGDTQPTIVTNLCLMSEPISRIDVSTERIPSSQTEKRLSPSTPMVISSLSPSYLIEEFRDVETKDEEDQTHFLPLEQKHHGLVEEVLPKSTAKDEQNEFEPSSSQSALEPSNTESLPDVAPELNNLQHTLFEAMPDLPSINALTVGSTCTDYKAHDREDEESDQPGNKKDGKYSKLRKNCSVQ